MDARDVWTRFDHDPRRTEHAHLRASDRDREILHDVLGDALADGRLSLAELEERSDRVGASRTLGELPALIDDLVPAHPHVSRIELLTPRTLRAEAERRYRAERRGALLVFLYASLISLAIWGASGAGFFWPAFVILASGIRPANLVLSRDDRIRRIERRLERKRTRAITSRVRRELGPGSG